MEESDDLLLYLIKSLQAHEHTGNPTVSYASEHAQMCSSKTDLSEIPSHSYRATQPKPVQKALNVDRPTTSPKVDEVQKNPPKEN